MRRTLLMGVMIAVLALANATAARAANLAGNWSASFKGHAITLHLVGGGATYTGVYTIATSYTLGKTKKTVKSSQPITVAVKVAQKTPTAILTFTKTRISTLCPISANKMRCVANATGQPIVFTHIG